MSRNFREGRREFMKGSAAMAGAGLVSHAGFPIDAIAASGDFVDLTAIQAVSAMINGEITAEAYARALLGRADAAGNLNAFIALDPEATLAAARAADQHRASGGKLGPLHGLPIPVKDAINTRDLPTTGGTAALKNFRPKEDAPIVQRLLTSGAVLMGKTNIHELSYGWTSNNRTTGAVRNPYDPTRIPGGSSGGSAAAVAARVAPLSVAEDTFGSIRVPASMCGIAGLRPSFGRYPNAGIIPITPKYYGTPGPHARSVADLALFDAVVTGEAAAPGGKTLKGVRIGLISEHLAGLDAEVERVMNDTAQRLQDAGIELVRISLPPTAQRSIEVGFGVISRETVPSMEAFLKAYGTGIGVEELMQQMSPELRGFWEAFVLPGGQLYASDEAYEGALAALMKIRAEMKAFFGENRLDAIAFPPVMMPPPPIGEDAEVEIGGQKVPLVVAMGRNIAIGSCGGLPGLVLPAGMTASGLPVGIEFDGPAGSDRELLALGMAIERILPPMPAPKL